MDSTPRHTWTGKKVFARVCALEKNTAHIYIICSYDGSSVLKNILFGHFSLLKRKTVKKDLTFCSCFSFFTFSLISLTQLYHISHCYSRQNTCQFCLNGFEFWLMGMLVQPASQYISLLVKAKWSVCIDNFSN